MTAVHAASHPSKASLDFGPWLFSPTVDLWAFAGSATAALLLVAVGRVLGWTTQPTPGWTWLTTILLIDVAHVYATGFRVFQSRREFRRRRWLYTLTPLFSFLLAAAVYSESVAWFWTVLAYLAVFHFVRQQYGWVALYRARQSDADAGRWLDVAAIYLATVYPLVVWHTLPQRDFVWFVEGDFGQLPTVLAQVLCPLYWVVMLAYAIRSARDIWLKRVWYLGKDMVVATTAVCWYVGIVAMNSEFAFTVTNVIIHGVPYMVLVYWLKPRRESPSSDRATEASPTSGIKTIQRIGWFVATLWLLAYVEELLWDCGVWRQHGWLFGCVGGSENAWFTPSGQSFWVPLLATPQITHYVLDGFIWRRSHLGAI